MTKIVSQLDAAGYFVCPTVADESPLEPGVYLLPGGAVDIAPPEAHELMRYRLDGEGWIAEPIPAPEPDPEPEPPTDEQLAASVRADRDARLAACDWVVVRSHELGQQVAEPWRVYREALRDVPEQAGFPRSIAWPVPPAA